MAERMETLEAEIYQMAGRRLNIASPKQLQDLLFSELKLPVVKKTAKTGPEHRRRGAGGACPVASAAGQNSRISAVCQAEEHLRRRLAGDDLPGDGPGPCLVQSGGGGHGPAEFQRPELAKHSRAHRGGPRDSLGVRARPRGLGFAGGRLLADRTAGVGPFFRRCPALRGVRSATKTSTPEWPAK